MEAIWTRTYNQRNHLPTNDVFKYKMNQNNAHQLKQKKSSRINRHFYFENIFVAVARFDLVHQSFTKYAAIHFECFYLIETHQWTVFQSITIELLPFIKYRRSLLLFFRFVGRYCIYVNGCVLSARVFFFWMSRTNWCVRSVFTNVDQLIMSNKWMHVWMNRSTICYVQNLNYSVRDLSLTCHSYTIYFTCTKKKTPAAHSTEFK